MNSIQTISKRIYNFLSWSHHSDFNFFFLKGSKCRIVHENFIIEEGGIHRNPILGLYCISGFNAFLTKLGLFFFRSDGSGQDLTKFNSC